MVCALPKFPGCPGYLWDRWCSVHSAAGDPRSGMEVPVRPTPPMNTVATGALCCDRLLFPRDSSASQHMLNAPLVCPGEEEVP